MVDLKEIRSVKIVPFTLMNASITAILGFISAIVFLLASGVISAFLPPQLSILSGIIVSIGISMIILLPVGGFLLEILQAFLTALFYNALVPKLGGIKLGFDGDVIKKIPVISFSLITSAISAIWAFIFGLLLAAVVIVIPGILSAVSTLPAVASNATAIQGLQGATGLFAILIPLFIIGLPIVTFIGSFIGYAIMALIYNYIIAKIGGIRLELEQTEGKFNAISSIPALALAIAVSIVFAIYIFIFQIPSFLAFAAQGDALTGLIYLIGYPVGYLVIYFITGALFAIFYNLLAPRIGAIELEFE
jgi:hypothetical protein